MQQSGALGITHEDRENANTCCDVGPRLRGQQGMQSGRELEVRDDRFVHERERERAEELAGLCEAAGRQIGTATVAGADPLGAANVMGRWWSDCEADDVHEKLDW